MDAINAARRLIDYYFLAAHFVLDTPSQRPLSLVILLVSMLKISTVRLRSRYIISFSRPEKCHSAFLFEVNKLSSPISGLRNRVESYSHLRCIAVPLSLRGSHLIQ
jgi:hypothetical protein